MCCMALQARFLLEGSCCEVGISPRRQLSLGTNEEAQEGKQDLLS